MENLRYVAVSHLTQQQAVNYLRTVNNHTGQIYNYQKQVSPIKRQPPPQQYVERTSPLKPKTQQKSLDQSLITPFLQKHSEQKLKEDYSRLWYQKLALETSVQRLLEENAKKDQIIRTLKMKLSAPIRPIPHH